MMTEFEYRMYEIILEATKHNDILWSEAMFCSDIIPRYKAKSSHPDFTNANWMRTIELTYWYSKTNRGTLCIESHETHKTAFVKLGRFTSARIKKHVLANVDRQEEQEERGSLSDNETMLRDFLKLID